MVPDHIHNIPRPVITHAKESYALMVLGDEVDELSRTRSALVAASNLRSDWLDSKRSQAASNLRFDWSPVLALVV